MNVPVSNPHPHVADELADLLVSGATGMTLLAHLRERFSKASRLDVFFGVAQAISLFEADRVGLLADLMVAEGELAAMKAGRPNG